MSTARCHATVRIDLDSPPKLCELDRSHEATGEMHKAGVIRWEPKRVLRVTADEKTKAVGR